MENDLEKSYREEISRMLTEASKLIENAQNLAQKHDIYLPIYLLEETNNLIESLQNSDIIDSGWDSSEKCW